MPYVYQNDWLQGYVYQLKDKNEVLERKMAKDKAAMNEMKKILKIKGLLDSGLDSTEAGCSYPKNNYSGLNALRARMKGSSLTLNDNQPTQPVPTDSTRHEYIGVPVNFFFKLNTAELTSKAQHLNIAEIAKVAKKHNLYVRIVGAADKATGTEERNKQLSEARAAFIAAQLEKRGVPKEQMVLEGLGGVSRFKPEEINRYTRVMLYHDLP
jgi:outer membrane protein OmpA-like peptidoglycan-associated protein